MPYKDLHSDPFDEATITKLEIFEDYAQAWLPVFIMQPAFKELHIFDFFAGPGYDVNGILGSPIRLLERVKSYEGLFLSNNTKVVLHLNEFEPGRGTKQEKYELLVKNCDELIQANPKFKYYLTVNYYNEDAGDLLFKLLPKIGDYPSLVYLDQNGVKFISKQYFSELEKLKMVDFLYYISSSYFWRLGSTEEFKKVIDFDMDELRKHRYENIHRVVISKIKEGLSSTSELKLFPFSLKKDKGIHGIVFGAKHYLAVDKFLDIVWKKNENNGEADFDIDHEIRTGQGNLFEEAKLTKVQKFKADLEAELVKRSLSSNSDVLVYAYENGHIPGHATEVVKSLKKDGKISFEGKTPGVNYDNVFKKKKIINYNGTI